MTGGFFFRFWVLFVRVRLFFVVTRKEKGVGSTAIRNSGGTREWVTSGVRVRKKKGKDKTHEAN